MDCPQHTYKADSLLYSNIFNIAFWKLATMLALLSDNVMAISVLITSYGFWENVPLLDDCGPKEMQDLLPDKIALAGRTKLILN